MRKSAVLALVAVAFFSTFDCSEAQVLRRFRSNVREAINPQVLPQQQIQTLNSAQPQVRRVQPRVSSQPRYVQPQVRIQRPAPQRITSGPQQLTPYSRLTPQQRVLVPQQQFSNGPRFNAPAPVGNPGIQPAAGARVRVVTYLDPSSGRTFQRRYLLPGNSPTGNARAPQGQVVTGRRSIFTQPTTTFGAATDLAANPSIGSVPQSTPSPRQSLVPTIQFAPPVAQQQPANASTGLLPALAGPVLAAPTATAQPIAASIDNVQNSPQIETASAEIETPPAGVETSSTGIPDLSGITVDPSPVDPEEKASQDLFFDNDSTDEMVEESADETPEASVNEIAEESEDDLFDANVDETVDLEDAPDYSVFEETEDE